MSGVKGQRPLGSGRSWEVRTHLTKEEWHKMHEIAEDNGMSNSAVLRAAWRRFFADYQRMSEMERVGLWLS